MARKLGIGVIGCGNISKTYFSLAPLFAGIEMRACADINETAAKARAAEFDLRAESVARELSNPAIENEMAARRRDVRAIVAAQSKN